MEEFDKKISTLHKGKTPPLYDAASIQVNWRRYDEDFRSFVSSTIFEKLNEVMILKSLRKLRGLFISLRTIYYTNKVLNGLNKARKT